MIGEVCRLRILSSATALKFAVASPLSGYLDTFCISTWWPRGDGLAGATGSAMTGERFSALPVPTEDEYLGNGGG